MLLNAIMNDELERVNSLTETQGMQEITHDFLSHLANYICIKQYDKALHYYEKIGQLRTYTQKKCAILQIYIMRLIIILHANQPSLILINYKEYKNQLIFEPKLFALINNDLFKSIFLLKTRNP